MRFQARLGRAYCKACRNGERNEQIGSETVFSKIRQSYEHTIYASYLGYITQAIINNFAPLLFLTFSRGAIYAFVVAMIFMVVMEGVWQKSWRVGKIFIIIALAFVFTLNLQGIMAQVSPTNDTYATGVAKVLNHLSLGVIDVRGNSSEEGASLEKIDASESEETGALEFLKTERKSEKKQNDDKEKGPEEAIFDGYVAESTDTRLKLTGAAVEVWKKDSATVLFGVGLGGAGQALYVNGLSPAPK